MPYAIPGTSTGGDLYRSVKPVPWNSHELLIFCLTSVLHYSLYSRVVIIVDQRFLILRFSLKILGGRTNNKHISFGDDKDFRSPGARIRTRPPPGKTPSIEGYLFFQNIGQNHIGAITQQTSVLSCQYYLVTTTSNSQNREKDSYTP